MPELPSGTVTLLFTDIEGSTRLLDELGDRYADVLAEHRRLLRDAFQRHGGVEVDTQGDAFFYAFGDAADAVAAAREAQLALAEGPVRVRIGIHTGEPIATVEGYVGMDVHRAARIMSAGHGGQVLVSRTTREHLDGDTGLIDLGLHRLKDLGEPEKLYQLGEGEFAPLRTLDATNLPVAMSALLGRDRELAELLPLLRNGARLVTITGPGGIGKTRLALQVAAEFVGSCKDGVFWVPLAGLSDPDLVLPRVAQTLGAREKLEDHLRGKELLLLLDNLEHLLPAAATPLGQLVASSKDLRLLVTSRAPLHLSGEREYPLEPLPQDDAVTLFCERARGVGRDVAPSEAVAAICRRLDGLPLALELAAARTKLLAPETLLERLEHALPLLTGGAHDAPERQQTLRATIAWSYELLEADVKRLFARLAIFEGSFSVDAAEHVCEADIDALAVLVDVNLLKSIGASRLLMLETIREFARERLEEPDPVRARHADYYLDLATGAAGLKLEQPDAGPLFDQLEEEMPNIRSALMAAEPERALRVAAELGRYWWVRGPGEGVQLLQRLFRRDIDPVLRLEVLRWLGGLIWVTGDSERAQPLAEERLTLARSVGDEEAVARTLSLLANLSRERGDFDAAARFDDDALDVARALGDAALLGHLLWSRAAGEDDFGDTSRAIELFEEALSAYGQANDERGIGHSRHGIGVTRCRRGEWVEAVEPLMAGLSALRAHGDTRMVAVTLDHLAAVAAATGSPGRAARLRGAGDAAWRSIGVAENEGYRPPYLDEAMEPARSALGAREYETERARGAALTLDEAVWFATKTEETVHYAPRDLLDA